MQAYIMSLHTPLAPWVGSKGQNIFFLKVVMLHIELNGIELRAPKGKRKDRYPRTTF